MDLVVDDDARVEARAAHVAEQHALLAHPLRELVGPDRAAGGAGAEQAERVGPRLVEADAAAEPLEEGEAAGEPRGAQLLVERGEVHVGAVLDERVEDRRRPAPRLALDREDAVRRGHEEVGELLLDRRLRRQLVLRVGVAPEEADRDRVDADLLDEAAGLGLDLLEVDRDEDRARPVGPLVDLGERAAVDEVGDVELEVIVDLRRPRPAGQAEGVAEAARDQHADAGAAQLGDRVGDDGRAVDEEPRVVEQLVHADVVAARGDLDRLQHAAAEVVVRRERLPALDGAPVHHRDVRVGPPDVDADERFAGSAVRVVIAHLSPRPTVGSTPW